MSDAAQLLATLPAPPPDRTGWPWTEPVPPLPPLMPDGTPWPRITIVTPSYNQARYLEATLRSALLQGYPNLEILVLDGGSTDDSVRIIRKYDKWLAYWVSERDGGQPVAINRGLGRATGAVLTWLNSDDILTPGALRRVALLVRARPEAVAWVGACFRFDTAGRITDTIFPRGLDRASLADWGGKGFFYQPSCFISARAWQKIGTLDQRLEYGFDVDLWLKLAEIGDFAETREVLSAALFHEMAKSGKGRMGQHVDTIALQVYHGFPDAAMRRLARLTARPRVRELVWMAARLRVKQALKRLGPNGRPLMRLTEQLSTMAAEERRIIPERIGS